MPRRRRPRNCCCARIIREESGLTPVAPAEKWRGGDLVLRPGKPGVQEKSWPIETFFHKVVMLRNRLRTLEQQVNASDLPDDQKVKLQSLHHRLLRVADELQRALRRRGRQVRRGSAGIVLPYSGSPSPFGSGSRAEQASPIA